MSSLHFTVNLPDDLRGFAEQQARRLGLPGVPAYLLELLRAASERAGGGGNTPGVPPTREDPFGFVDELASQIPDDELSQLPSDGSVNLDHYLYGHPRKERS